MTAFFFFFLNVLCVYIMGLFWCFLANFFFSLNPDIKTAYGNNVNVKKCKENYEYVSLVLVKFFLPFIYIENLKYGLGIFVRPTIKVFRKLIYLAFFKFPVLLFLVKFKETNVIRSKKQKTHDHIFNYSGKLCMFRNIYKRHLTILLF